METLQKDREDIKELDDSGCVQDGPPLKQPDGDSKETKEAKLLDLSDDVLLYILKNCSPRDLKALGYTCPRLGRLICDRTLWQRVDAREEPTGRARLRWLLAHALGSNTTELLLTGYAREARGCLGHVDRKRKDIEDAIPVLNKNKEDKNSQAATTSASEPSQEGSSSFSDGPAQLVDVDPLSRLRRLYAQQLPRYSGILTWPEDDSAEVDPEDVVLLDGSCSGPQFTLTQCMLRQLRSQCSLTSLALQYCNINCNTTGINHFPPTLNRLSLRGSKCYNLPLDKSFLFNIQDYLPQLEYLDLSECDWLEPASFLPLSKVNKLTDLIIRDCHRMAEFVAYASLATRYGFRKLKHLDARGSPLGDSEVAALGWLPSLEELYLSPARAPPPRPPDHSHCRDERLPPHTDLLPWELQEPEYFKIKPQLVEPMDTRSTTSMDDIEEHIEQLRNYENNICLHGLEYNLCMEGIRRGSRNRSEQSEDTDMETLNSSQISTDSKQEMDTAQSSTSPKNDTNNIQPSTSHENLTNTTQPSPEKVTNNTHYSTNLNENKNVLFNAKNLTKHTSQAPYFKDVSFKPTNFKEMPEPSTSKNETNNAEPSTNYRNIVAGPSLQRPTTNEDIIPSKPTNSKEMPEPSTSKNETNNAERSTTYRNIVAGPSLQRPTTNEDIIPSKPTNSKEMSEPSTSKNETNNAEPSTSYRNIVAGPSLKRPTTNEDIIPSKKIKFKGNPLNFAFENDTDDDDDDDDTKKNDSKNDHNSKKDESSEASDECYSSEDDIPLKNMCKNNINEGASTSKDEPKPKDQPKDDSNDKSKKKKYELVRFRRNMDPVIVKRDADEFDEEERQREIREREVRERQRNDNQNREARPRAHVLYVNIGQQLHTVYRLSVFNEPPTYYSYSRNSHLRYRPNTTGNVFYTPPRRLDATSLVTDSAVRRFGRADTDDVNVVFFGPSRPGADPGARPNRSNLRTLSVTGFRNITDRSLEHLATAAPHLRFVDFSESGVTAQGVENFKSLRPDCEVIFSSYVERDEAA